jgi:peptide methionine sulfoxide reductase MsrA
MTTETTIRCRKTLHVLFSICHPVKIVADQKTDHSTDYRSDYNGCNSARGEIANAQSKDCKKNNEDQSTFALDP